MNKTTTKFLIAALVTVAVGAAALQYHKEEKVVGCTEEAKICPDGSAVGRSGPQCEFTACPEVIATTTPPQSQGTLKGQVTIGPVCPVETVGNPCKPTAEMYAAAKVFVYTSDKKTLLKTITPDQNGKFSINLLPGTYFIDMIHQRMGGTTGVPTTITILSGKATTLNLDVDTGLR